MTTTTLAQALTAQTEAEILVGLLATLEAENVDLAGFSPFALGTTLPVLNARALAAAQQLRVLVTKAGFLDLVAGISDEWVDKIVKAWFGITRIPATQARHLFKVALANSAPTVDVVAGALVADAGGVLFDNGTGIKLNPNTAQLKEFVARLPGITGNILPNAVTGFQKGKPGLTVTNPAGTLLAAGRNKESNADFIARGRAKFPAKSRGGARAAYLVWVEEAFSSQGLVSTITKIGVDDENPNGAGSTDLYLANAAGAATVAELAIVGTYLQPRRGLGTGPLRVLPAPTLNVTITLVLYVNGNLNAIGDALVILNALVSDFPLGGTLYLDTIRGALLGPDGVTGVYKIDVNSPAADTQLVGFQRLTATLNVKVKN